MTPGLHEVAVSLVDADLRPAQGAVVVLTHVVVAAGARCVE